MHIDFPLGFDALGRTRATGEYDHVRDMILQLLFTEPGERVNRPDFGCGLRQLLFAPNSQELAAAVQFVMRASLERWLGDVIEVHDLAVSADESSLSVDLSYVTRRDGDSRHETFTREIAP